MTNIFPPSNASSENNRFDAVQEGRHARPVLGYGFRLCLSRRDPARNMARYYTLAVEITLFGDWSCRREFGRIGRRGGRVMIGLLARKRARGYEITETR
jgi:hypothetical protein